MQDILTPHHQICEQWWTFQFPNAVGRYPLFDPRWDFTQQTDLHIIVFYITLRYTLHNSFFSSLKNFNNLSTRTATTINQFNVYIHNNVIANKFFRLKTLPSHFTLPFTEKKILKKIILSPQFLHQKKPWHVL